jgi:hypothetical protein
LVAAKDERFAVVRQLNERDVLIRDRKVSGVSPNAQVV